jgi:hypothetical protein
LEDGNQIFFNFWNNGIFCFLTDDLRKQRQNDREKKKKYLMTFHGSIIRWFLDFSISWRTEERAISSLDYLTMYVRNKGCAIAHRNSPKGDFCLVNFMLTGECATAPTSYLFGFACSLASSWINEHGQGVNLIL